MDFGRFCGFYNQRNSGILSGAYQIGFQCCNCQQGRNCKVFLVNTTVCQNQNCCSGIVCSICLCIQIGNRICQRSILGIQHGNVSCLQALNVRIPNFHQIQTGQNRIFYFQHSAVCLFFFQKVASCSQINGCICDDRFPNGINRRIGNLCEQLLEIVEQRRILLGKRRNRHINTHGCGRFATVQSHWNHHAVHGFIGIAKCTLQPLQFHTVIPERTLVRNFQVCQRIQVVV